MATVHTFNENKIVINKDYYSVISKNFETLLTCFEECYDKKDVISFFIRRKLDNGEYHIGFAAIPIEKLIENIDQESVISILFNKEKSFTIMCDIDNT